LIPNFLWLLWLLSLKNDVDEPSKRKKQKNIRKKQFFLASWRSMTKIAGSGAGSISQRHGSAPKCHGGNNARHLSKFTHRLIIATRVSEPDQLFFCLKEPGSGSFYYQAKLVRKTLIPTVLWLLYDFLSLKNDVYVHSKSNKQINLLVYTFPNFALQSQWYLRP
jgi:hypothetical protein